MALRAELGPEERILDIGCGIGGPTHWLAWQFGCHVTGIDLTRTFCEAAEKLTAACGLGQRVHILHGSALDLPLPDAVFDKAYSENVVMNIADKPAMYREAWHVLKPDGRLVLSNLIQGPIGPPFFPVPWANVASQSFLATIEETRRDLGAVGFEIVSFEDISERILPGLIAFLARMETAGPPRLGIHVWLRAGAQEQERTVNSLCSLVEGRVRAIEVVARKPG